MSHGDIHCVTSYNFIEADLRSIVRPVDSRRGVVCVRERMCARCVLARPSRPTCRWRSDTTSTHATQRPRKVRNVVKLVLFTFILCIEEITGSYLPRTSFVAICSESSQSTDVCINVAHRAMIKRFIWVGSIVATRHCSGKLFSGTIKIKFQYSIGSCLPSICSIDRTENKKLQVKA